MLKKILQINYIYYILVSIVLVFSLLYTNLYKAKSKYNSEENNFFGTIEKFNIDGNKLSITINSDEKLIGTYYIKTFTQHQNIIMKSSQKDNLLLAQK